MKWQRAARPPLQVVLIAPIPARQNRSLGELHVRNVVRLIARLQQPAIHCEPFTPNDSTALRDTLRPGDVLLVESKGRISGGIKYLTQSTWSHSALYVGPMAGAATDGEPHVLIEANIDEGVVSAPLSKYLHCQTRICRPVGVSERTAQRSAATPPNALVSATISRTSST